MSSHLVLATILGELAEGRRPSLDSQHVIEGPPSGPMEGVAAFTGLNVIATSLPPHEVWGQLDPSDLGAPLRLTFLSWLSQRLNRTPGLLQVVCVHAGLGGGTEQLESTDAFERHPRVKRARRTRNDVSVYAATNGVGFVTLGRGLCRRWEMGYEVNSEDRDRGHGRRLMEAARRIVPAGVAVYVQIPPANAASLRAALAAGFRPIGAEVLFQRKEEEKSGA
jgi:hypothetical protein